MKASVGVGSRAQARITPVNSALVAAAASKPTRDPRLMRQQAEKPSNGTAASNSSTSVPLGPKPAILDSNNKVVTNTKGLRDSRVEARLVNKDNALPPPPKPKAFLKSRQPEPKPRKGADAKASKASDSPTKKGESKSPTKPAGRHKKKEHGSGDIKGFKEPKRDRDGKGHKGDSPPTFKGAKGPKSRNYIRRNRSPSYSPEPSHLDTDLRLAGPPPEKLARLQDEDKRKLLPPPLTSGAAAAPGKAAGPQGMDVDLRQLAEGPKKRLSGESLESAANKKSKHEVLDALFGNEDTDLRTVLPVAQPERPPTPPPPIISYSEKDKDSPKKPSDLDAVRAKLANATGRDKIMAKSFRKKRPQEDEDLRVPPASPNDSLKRIIISSDDEQCIKAGTMTKEQEKQLMNKIIAQIEQQKLQEAQLRDKAESALQPVSDEELEGDRDERVPRFREARRAFWRGKRRHREAARPPVRPWLHQQAWRPMAPAFRPPEAGPAPEAAEVTVDPVNQDGIRTIDIDKVPRDIRFYDETAIVFMNWDDPREISFQSGSRRVVFDDQEVYLLAFDEGYKEVSVRGATHRVKLGAPTREIFIDGRPYECYFGGPGITIDLDGRMTTVKLEKPPPDVRIGTVRRTDLVAGKVNLIIDAKILVPVFLDAKVQKFVIDGETHTLRFVDALKTVLINDVPFKVEFGGLPKPITVHDKKHFIRFSVLPKGIKPGLVCIKDMEGAPAEPEDGQEGSAFVGVDINEPALPVFPRKKKVEDEQERNSNSPHFFQNFMQQNNLDVLSSVMTSSMTPSASSGGYQVENLLPAPEVRVDAPLPALPPSLNINELFQKLVATGIVATKEPEPPKPRRHPLEHLRSVTFARPESLRPRQGALYEALYAGMQCSSCGMRFPPEQSMRYSQHLDWHFRQNRRGKRNIRVGATRRWFYALADWMNYVEVEDLEERENYFDQQLLQEGAADEADEEAEAPSVPADAEVQETHCEVCRDKFDQFFNEDKEEWHLRNAVRVEDRTYHPLCFEDYQAALLEESTAEEAPALEEKAEEPNIPGLEIVLDDDDDEEEPPKEEEVVIDESDESKPSHEEAKEEPEEEDDDDDDVIINEVVPEKIEVDDDKEYTDSLPSEVPIKVEQIDDGFMDVEEGLMKIKNGSQIKIKSEPIDPDEVALVTPPEDHPAPFSEPVQPTIISSIDGNTEPAASVPTTTASIGSKIKINISKPLPVITPKEPKETPCDSVTSLEPVIDPSQPLPPGEEPVQLNVKPALRGLELKKLPPVQKGSELTGMCSIM